tara:strand:- start:13128 stop:13565 length:438 start_codon:yes stop_codon:yes gene_type:complete
MYRRPITFMEDACLFIEELTNISREDFLSKSRYREFVTARHFLRYTLRNKYFLGWSEIARMTECNHASVINSINVINKVCCFDENFSRLRDSVDGFVIIKASRLESTVRRILTATTTENVKIAGLLSVIVAEKSRTKNELQGTEQ